MSRTFTSDSAVYKMTRKIRQDRKIYGMPRPFLQNATPHRQLGFSEETRRAAEQITSTFSICKAIFVGDVAVGKTSLVNRFCRHTFDYNYKATIGVDFEVERFEILGVNFNLQIWDTAGQERFKCIAQSYYRGANVIVLVFSLCDISSLLHTGTWLKESTRTNNSKPLIFLVGTKRDKVTSSVYATIEAEAIRVANELNAEYWSVSARTGDCVNHFFNRLAAVSFDKLMQEYFNERTETRTIGNPIALSQDVQSKTEKRFCGDKCL